MNQGQKRNRGQTSRFSKRLERSQTHVLGRSGLDGCGGDGSGTRKRNTKVMNDNSKEHPILEREFGKFGRRNIWVEFGIRRIRMVSKLTNPKYNCKLVRMA